MKKKKNSLFFVFIYHSRLKLMYLKIIFNKSDLNIELNDT
jgi:hypothetical protein